MSNHVTIALVGDSDIAYWPKQLFPNVAQGSGCLVGPILVSGQGGDTLEEILPRVRSIIDDATTSTTAETPPSASSRSIIVACAGENDIGSGYTLDQTLDSFHRLLAIVFDESSFAMSNRTKNWLIFLGPKFEPWLVDDPGSRKKYVKMSKAFEKACSNHRDSTQIVFVNCLTMFCGDTAEVPGAVLGGKAVADPKYFAADGLHLNDSGYMVWKKVVEERFAQIISEV